MPIEPQILHLIKELDSLRETRDDHWQIPLIEGDLLYQLAISVGARSIVEVGTSYGFSSLFWGAALKRVGGTLHTIDNSPKKFESSKATFARAGLDRTIVNYLGDAMQALPKIAGPFDLAFLDCGEKKLTGPLFDLVWPKLRPGGSVVTDNATTHKAELSDFIAYVRGRSDAASLELAVGNGIEWTVKLT